MWPSTGGRCSEPHSCMWYQKIVWLPHLSASSVVPHAHCRPPSSGADPLRPIRRPASPDRIPNVPADKRGATGADITAGLRGSRWPQSCVWKQGELPSLRSDQEPLEAAVFLKETAEGLTRLDCINICHV